MSWHLWLLLAIIVIYILAGIIWFVSVVIADRNGTSTWWEDMW